MPLYEYLCDQDGSVIELLRPAADADKPVPDPEDRARTFKRKFSVFAAQSTTGSTPAPSGGCCPCGKTRGSCGAR